MKRKSEYEEERQGYWLSQALRPEAGDLWLRERVARDVDAVEAAGIPWVPEEEPLPVFLVASKGPVGWVVMAQLPPGVTGPDYRWLSKAEAAEVIRRHNAWPAIRAWAKRHGDSREPFWVFLEKIMNEPKGCP